jgi:hypothetical protein
VTYTWVGASDRFPAYIVGPVVEEAARVRVHLADGESVDIATVPAPDGLNESVRFYASSLPCDAVPKQLIGLAADGSQVAELAVAEPHRPTAINCG